MSQHSFEMCQQKLENNSKNAYNKNYLKRIISNYFIKFAAIAPTALRTKVGEMFC